VLAEHDTCTCQVPLGRGVVPPGAYMLDVEILDAFGGSVRAAQLLVQPAGPWGRRASAPLLVDALI